MGLYDECTANLCMLCIFIFRFFNCNNSNTKLPVWNKLDVIMQTVMLLNLLCVIQLQFCSFSLLPSALHYRRWISLWQLITVARYLDRTVWFATRHRFRSFRGNRMGNKRTALVLEEADWKWMTQRTRHPYDCLRSGPPWATPSSWTPAASAQSTATWLPRKREVLFVASLTCRHLF